MKRKLQLIITLMMVLCISPLFAQKSEFQAEFKQKIEALKQQKTKRLYERQDLKERVYEKKQVQQPVLRSGKLPLAVLSMEYNQTGGKDTSGILYKAYKTGSALLENEIFHDYLGDGEFEKSQKVAYTYNADNKKTAEIYYYWDDSDEEWLPTYKVETIYDQMGNLEMEADSEWNPASESWELSFAFKMEHTYNVNSDIERVTISIFSDGNWEFLQQAERIYNSDGHWSSSLYLMYDNSWELAYKEEYTLNADGEWTEALLYEWDFFSSDWELSGKLMDITWHNFKEFILTGYSYLEYDGSNFENIFRFSAAYNTNDDILFEIYELWMGTNWEFVERNVLTYDVKNNMIEHLYQSYDVNSNSWFTVNGNKSPYTYDANDDIDYIDYAFWGGTWIMTHREIYLYDLNFTSVKNLKPEVKFSLYPNPAKDRLTLALTSEERSVINIFNITGQVVLTEQVPAYTSQVTFDISALERGIYFVKINSGAVSTTQKLIKN